MDLSFQTRKEIDEEWENEIKDAGWHILSGCSANACPMLELSPAGS